jgi:hypothetical protein
MGTAKETQRRPERLTWQGKRADTLDSPIDKLSTRITDRFPSVHCVREPKALTAFPHGGEIVMPPMMSVPMTTLSSEPSANPASKPGTQLNLPTCRLMCSATS